MLTRPSAGSAATAAVSVLTHHAAGSAAAAAAAASTSARRRTAGAKPEQQGPRGISYLKPKQSQEHHAERHLVGASRPGVRARQGSPPARCDITPRWGGVVSLSDARVRRGTLSRLSAHSHPRRGLFVLELFVLAVPPAVL
jgi:hypothetical protein